MMTIPMQPVHTVRSANTIPNIQPQISSHNLLFGRFLIESTLVKGAFDVFRAIDKQTSRPVALKVLRRKPEQSDESWHIACRKFEQEALFTQLAQHKNTVKFEGFFRNPMIECLALEYLDGVTLRYWLEKRQPTAAQIIYIMTEICKALHHLHSIGFVHRDLKPENIMLTRNNRVVLIDFGIAFDMVGDPAITEAGIIRGTPGYLAPEQIRSKPFSPATDLYALGVIMFEMVTGFPLFDGGNFDEIILQQVEHTIPSIRSYLPNAKEKSWRRIARVIRRCLRLSPSDRFKNTAEFWRALVGKEAPFPTSPTWTHEKALPLSS